MCRGGAKASQQMEVTHLLVDELAQRDLGPPLDLEADELVNQLPVPLLQALVAEVDYNGEYGAEVVHIVLLDQGCSIGQSGLRIKANQTYPTKACLNTD